MLTIIKEIQSNDYSRFQVLLDRFKPLINAWLYKTKVALSDREDFLSHAKIILLECALDYDATRNVPFASYYKIRLYHWYGNYISKKQIQTVSEEMINYDSVMVDYDERLQDEEKIRLLLALDHHLTNQESYILHALLRDETETAIGQTLSLSKKTVLNKKYEIIRKLKQHIHEVKT